MKLMQWCAIFLCAFFFSFLNADYSHDFLPSHNVLEMRDTLFLSNTNTNYTHNQSGVYVTVSTKPTHHHVTDTNHPNLHTCSIEQLKQYFSGSSEAYIFKNPTLFMSDAFVTFAQTMPGYERYLLAWYKKIIKKWGITKAWDSAWGAHCRGLTDRITQLHYELQQEKQAKHRAQQRHAEEQKRVAVYKQKLSHIPCTHAARSQALQNTHHNPLSRTRRSFALNSDVLACAQRYALKPHDLTSGVMNAYEYQLHTEFIDQLHELCALHKSYPEQTQNIFVDALGQSIALGVEANNKHEPVMVQPSLIQAFRLGKLWRTSTKLKFIDWPCQPKLVRAKVGEGVVLGAQNTVSFIKNVACYPIQTVCDIGHGIGVMCCALGKVLGEGVKIQTYMDAHDASALAQEFERLDTSVCEIKNVCAAKIAITSNREIAKQVTAFATDWVLVSKAFTFGHSICRRAGPLIGEMLELLKKEPAVEMAFFV